MRSASPFLLPCALVLASAGRIGAQDASLRQREEEVDWERVVVSRDREAMHPGDPTAVVGLEEGDDGFHDRAPALRRADHQPVLVDLEESRRRRLAMLEERASFRRPLPVDLHATRAAAEGARRGRARPSGPPFDPAEGHGGPLGWLRIPAIVAAAICSALWTRHRLVPAPKPSGPSGRAQ